MSSPNRCEKIREIAKKLLGLKTLEPRNSDQLDFYDLSVWQVREALEAAYDAGFKAAGGQITGSEM